MTREEAIALRPASRVTYWTSLVAAALIVALGLDWSFFVKRLSIFGELASVAVIAGYSVLGLQAYLRLFRPEVSAKIALRFSPDTKTRLRQIGVTAQFLGLGVAIFGMSSHHHGWGVLGWGIYALNPALADLAGERFTGPPPPARRQYNASIGPATQWQPIASDHWHDR
ncbi:hypothetical protein [Granulicella cerasi]|uniref:hypothetical protein n=1 Tax=Granulicella cerasi TaxID=741063 RepID=UPI0021E01E25|nr:hypothetical protein [Granulicella cerasi]